MKQIFKRAGLLCLSMAMLVSCGEEVKKDASDVSDASTLNLVQKYQRVKRYDCKGALVSDKVETVHAPTYMISLRPKTKINLYHATFENLTNGSSAGCTFNDDSFTVDYGGGWCNMRVQSGGNQIRYRFFYCDQYSSENQGDGSSIQTCAVEPVLREEGTTWIKINYSEETLSGFVEYRPSSCQQ